MYRRRTEEALGAYSSYVLRGAAFMTLLNVAPADEALAHA